MKSMDYQVAMTNQISAIRGPVLTYTDDPYIDAADVRLGYEPDAIIMMANGQITDFGPANKLKDKIPTGLSITEFRNCRIIKICNHS